MCRQTLSMAPPDLLQEHMKDLHTVGHRPFIFDKNVMHSMSSTQGFTFKRRLDDICEALEASPTPSQHTVH
jgi:hypothetical protein